MSDADGAGGGYDEFGSGAAERRRDECAAQLQRDNAGPVDHGRDDECEFHDQLDGEHSDGGGKHDGAGRVHRRLGRGYSDSRRSELDLQYRVEHESSTGTDEPGSDGGQRAGRVELECVEWGDELQRAAVDDEWRTVHDDWDSDDDELHRHGSDERDDVLLRSGGGEHGGAECEFQPGKCDAAADNTTGTDESGSDGGECAGGVELECFEWSDKLQRAAVDDERGTVHDDWKPDNDELHGHGSDERDDLLLRGSCSEHGGTECELQPSKCDTTGGDTASTDESGSNTRECAGGLELERIEWGDKLQRAAVDDERRTIHDDRKSDDDELHRHGSDERDDVLLRSGGGKHGGAECEFQPSKCDAARDTTGTDELGGNGGERAGGVELECVEWGNQLQREEIDDERGTVHGDWESDHDQLHRHGSDERDDVLLRGRSGEHGGAECELQPGERNARAGNTTGADESGSDGGKRSGGVELECLEWSDELQRAAVNDEWGTVHGDCEPNDDQLHGRRGDERDDVLLRGGSSKHGGAECELQPGELDPDGVFDQLR